MEKMFELATKMKLRFPYNGLISTEDLWDLSETALDKIYKTLNAKVKQSQEASLLTVKTKEEEVLNTQIEIVKYIFSIKLEEKISREKAVENKAKKQRLMAILDRKENEALENMSSEELQKMINEL